MARVVRKFFRKYATAAVRTWDGPCEEAKIGGGGGEEGILTERGENREFDAPLSSLPSAPFLRPRARGQLSRTVRSN